MLFRSMQAPQIGATLANVNATCNGSADGKITISNPVNGISPYKYRLGTTGSFTSLAPPVTISSLKAANYIVAIQDSTGCTNNLRDTIRQPDKIVASFTKVDETCPLAKDGSITLTSVGGVPPYLYRLGTVGAYVSTNTFTGLAAGTYRVYVKDSIGCAGASVVITIGQKSTTCAPAIARVSNVIGDFNPASFSTFLSPNPSSSNFTLTIESQKKQPVHVRVLDANVRTVYEAQGQAGESFRFGDNFINGLYLVEVRQGDEVRMIKAVKSR